MITQTDLERLTERVKRLSESNPDANEETTKHALVLPFLSALGYDVFNPDEIAAEFTADFGTKKGDKVDYVVYSDGKPGVLIECKPLNSQLRAVTASQLARYFASTTATVGILTNGNTYKLFTDVDKDNVMDDVPFTEFSVADALPDTVHILNLLTKHNFDAASIRDYAESKHHISGMSNYLRRQIANPDDDFVRLLAQQVSDRRLTAGWIDQCRIYARIALRQVVGEKTEQLAPKETTLEEPEEVGIVTTAEEVEAFELVRALCDSVISHDRVTMRDHVGHCSVLVDDNIKKKLCDLYLEGDEWKVEIIDSFGDAATHHIDVVQDLRRFSAELKEQARFLGTAQASNRSYYRKKNVV